MEFRDREIISAKISIAENQAIIDARHFEDLSRQFEDKARDCREQASLLCQARLQLYTDGKENLEWHDPF